MSPQIFSIRSVLLTNMLSCYISPRTNKLHNNWFPPSLRSGGNAAPSGLCLCPRSARAGNQAQETDALRAPLSAALNLSSGIPHFSLALDFVEW